MFIRPSNQAQAPRLPPTTRVVQALAPHRARLTFEPLAAGMGCTLGTALQQVHARAATAGPDAPSPDGHGAWAFAVEPCRVGQRTDLDRLVLDIATDGRQSPSEALAQVGKLLSALLDGLAEPQAEAPPTGQPNLDSCVSPRTIDELELSLRASNALKSADIYYLIQLVERTETDLLRSPILGRKALDEIKHALAVRGLLLRMSPQDGSRTGGGSR